MTRHIHVDSIAAAWKKADEIFPSDYEHDTKRSARAGYPVYFSTGAEYAWISELRERLELNMPNGDTVNIWIDAAPEIEVTEAWYADGVRAVCVKQGFYTCGTCSDYDHMLNMVNDTEPTPTNLYRVARDICEHSDGQTIENIMFILSRDAVDRFYLF